ncbi:MAG TPA: ABC transporter ATP-binding protein [Caldilineaceae bacterium]|nr:ABC transporter ATP-binding protein [Caldilineaceae bacterium]
MSEYAIRVEQLSKRYRIGKRQERPQTLAQALAGLVRSPLDNYRRLRAMRHFSDNGHDEPDVIWALRDVSFDVRHGEVVGIIGRNGAGKSTLLKILSRIVEPTSGRAVLNGRVASLLEVGTGFHPDLTGRENVYLNGTLLGMRRSEVDRKFDEIVDFAGVEKFIDTPVRFYSSGMRVRLAFAVAAHLDAEILLIDEVLAVGDAEFQQKCLGKMGEVSRGGRSVLFVSHNMQAVTALCRQTIWLDRGGIRHIGPSEATVSEYLSSGASATGWWRRPQSIPPADELELVGARVSQAGNSPVPVVSSSEPFNIEIEYEVKSELRNCSIFLVLTNVNGTVVFSSADTDSNKQLLQYRAQGIYKSICTVPAHLLKPSHYAVTVGAHIYRIRFLDLQDHVFGFHVSDIGFQLEVERQGVILPLLAWNVEIQESRHKELAHC